MDKQDAIIIGAGLNGLVAAAYLVKSGRRVTIICQGGAGLVDYSDPVPGMDGIAFETHGGQNLTLPNSIVWDLGLEALGLRFAPPRSSAVVTGDGVLIRDADPTAMDRRLRAWSPREADAYRNFLSLIVRQRRLLDRYLEQGWGQKLSRRATLKILQDASQDGMLEAAALYSGSLRDTLDRLFESDLLKMAFLAGALEGPFSGMGLGPWSPTSGIGLLFDSLSLSGYQSPWPGRRIEGGRRAVVKALQEFIGAAGGTFIRDTKVTEVVTAKGVAKAVALEGGQYIEASEIIADIDVKRTAFSLVDWKTLPEDLALGIANIRSRAQVAQVNFVLSDWPNPAALHDGFLSGGVLHILQGLEKTERSFDDWKSGRLSPHCPIQFEVWKEEGKVLATAFVHFVPGALAEGEWDDKTKLALIGQVVKAVAGMAPGFETTLVDARAVTPIDFEKRFGLIGGHHQGGETALDQLLFHRPTPDLSRNYQIMDSLSFLGLATPLSPFMDGMPGYVLARDLIAEPRWPWQTRGEIKAQQSGQGRQS